MELNRGSTGAAAFVEGLSSLKILSLHRHLEHAVPLTTTENGGASPLTASHTAQISDYLDEYAAKFWVAKQPRKLSWKRHLGTVELSLSIRGASRDFTVTPFQATALMHFQVCLNPKP